MAIASQIERWQFSRKTAEALDAALKLYRRVMAAGENAYPEAVLDNAVACLIFGEALSNAGVANQALPILQDAQQRFERIGQEPRAKRLAVKTLIVQGDSFRELGRWDEAAITYEESIRRSEKLGDRHAIAIAKSEFGSVYVFQQRYSEAQLAYGEAMEILHALGDRYNLAGIWYLIGRVYAETGRYEEAEHAFLAALAIKGQLADEGGVAYGMGA